MTDIEKGKICPYCGGEPIFTDSCEIYGKSYGMISLCRPCDAYCGVHKGTNKPLGRLADKKLREMKKLAHAAFDPIWQEKILNRKEAYKWLSAKLNISEQRCHIGMFDIETCLLVINSCKLFNHEHHITINRG
ncbi:DUF3268 family zinc-finger domain-containing protein [Chitinophaga nivalis]|uniref:DUF3268 family zinc-finger domain-containing protein n=1 Tax=Chitinophaga nivalis TaxID=2991709 RepID=A0ABT3IIJ7_9BACT|nr:DUF3268 family zinc-finger domain-containing protein [Chitinophaga nivalis]MCW3466528.1 DUF3268 family zinc-finger domain-containing protein [Chitinophaga nivalis]MCW3483781.1 DUF3268 family zinc-finger domain-containing protein [Chitinophaga nivalis]